MEPLNKTYAIAYFEKFGFNVLPVKEKRPLIAWDKWQSEKQTIDDIERMDWSNATGIGVVMGINDLRCIDIDGIENPDLIKMLLIDFGLPEDYSWVVQSGSGNGCHIYFRSLIPSPSSKEKGDEHALTSKEKGDEHAFTSKEKGNEHTSRNELGTSTTPLERGLENMLDEIGGEKAVYKFKMKVDGLCHHLEYRVRECQTLLPPSLHPSGGIYDFMNNDLTEIPQEIESEKVIEVLKKHCVIEKNEVREEKNYNKPNYFTEKKYFDEDTLLSAVEYLGKHLPEGSYDEWLKCGFACASLGEAGYEYFKTMSLSNPNYNDSEYEIRQKFNSLLRDYDGRITLGTIYHIAEVNGWRKPFLKFWDIDERGRIKLSRTKFKKLLEREGFFKLKIDPANGASSNYLFVRSEQNIVEEFDQIFVKDYVLNYLNSVPIEEFEGTSRAEVIDALIKSSSQLFVQGFFEFLITKKIEFQRDTKDTGYLFFRNCVVEVTKDGKRIISYKQLEKYIWKNQIIDGDYYPSDAHTDFEDFKFNVCNRETERLKALKSATGYLLHKYKDPNQAKAIIFIDEKLSEGAYGRSGKGLVIKAIGKIRNIVTEDGRNFDVGKNFAFQRVNADTEIISIEDMKERFPFDKLFSILTEGITIEKKNKDEIYIPFSESPKVVISTNYSIKGVDDSTLDRQFIVEFSDHYNRQNRPIDEFGKLFFEGWNKDEWNAFYNYMIGCLQFYLANGLMAYAYVNLERKRLIDETCAEFAEFSDGLVLNEAYNKKELFEEFISEFPELEKLNQGKFTRWLKIWARIKNIEVVESKSGATRMIEFKGMREAA